MARRTAKPRTARAKNHVDDWDDCLAFRSSNPHVPRSYRLDPEFNCLTNSENLARSNRKLRYVEGWARMGDEAEGAHAWCTAPDGSIVDPYFEWRFGDAQKAITYRAARRGEAPFA